MLVVKLCCIAQEDDLVTLAALHYSIRFDSAYNREHLQEVVEECVTAQLIESGGMTKWIDLIGSAHLQVQHRSSPGLGFR